MSPRQYLSLISIATLSAMISSLDAATPLRVSAGNPAGESAAVDAIEGFVPMPEVMGVSALRMDKNTVKISWEPVSFASIAEADQHFYVIFRADNNDASWIQVATLSARPIAMGIAEPWYSDPAVAPGRYRYVVCTRRSYQQAADGFITVHSKPSGEGAGTTVDHAEAALKAGGIMYFDNSANIAPPQGFFLISDFIPEDHIAGYPPVPPQNPAGVSGQLDEIEFGWSPHYRYDAAGGFLPRGKTLSASANVTTMPAPIPGEYPLALLTIGENEPWTGLIPPETYINDGRTLVLASEFGIYSCEFRHQFVRDRGFDSVTNPMTQMLHAGGDAETVEFKVTPMAPVAGSTFPLMTGAQVTVNPLGVAQGSADVSITTAAHGTSDINVGNLVPILRVQGLARKTIRVAIVAVLTIEAGFPIAEDLMLSDPAIANIRQRMDQTFLRNANIKVECVVAPFEIMDDDDDDTATSGDDGALNIGTTNDRQRPFALRDAIKIEQACDYVIFWVHNVGPSAGGRTIFFNRLITVASAANGAPDPGTCCHELGHALGLHHPWQPSPYSQTVFPDSPDIRVMGYGPMGGWYFLPMEREIMHEIMHEVLQTDGIP
jgi:hypothetical protein